MQSQPAPIYMSSQYSEYKKRLRQNCRHKHSVSSAKYGFYIHVEGFTPANARYDYSPNKPRNITGESGSLNSHW